MTTYARVRFADVRREIMPLIMAHQEEVSVEQLALNIASYEALDDNGNLFLMMVYDGARPIGYIAHGVVTHPHDGLRHAHGDAYYLDPAHRRGTAAARMVRWAEQLLAEEGVQRITYAVPWGSRQELLFLHAGYQPTESIYTKRLED